MDSNPEINALKQRIRELEDTIVHYEASRGQQADMLRRIQEILDEAEDDREVL
ncbi:MAG: hypothetical protein GWP10_21165 [Nitrospiraceae bacterium]|nr:hypothetical protein [Nitrospiraceae bacterium]